jgi:hypothetical protein
MCPWTFFMSEDRNVCPWTGNFFLWTGFSVHGQKFLSADRPLSTGPTRPNRKPYKLKNKSICNLCGSD